VSRHHALLLQGARELIIEDLNSTNGVVVNDRKVSRQILRDGDLVTIGEIQFRCVLKPTLRAADAPSGPTAGEAPAAAGSGVRPVEADASGADPVGAP
jgi:pSer/pThr/pTyr-binding forkhead associated (FHA) protein